MARENDRPAPLQELRLQERGRGIIEVIGRLVEQQRRRAAEQISARSAASSARA